LRKDEIASFGNQQDVRLSDKRILPVLPKSIRDIEKVLRSRIFKDLKSMENEGTNRLKRVTTRFKEDEFKLIDHRFRKTRFRKLSEYIRCVLLEKPIMVMYRDKSMDEVLEELILLRKELNAIGNNLNQTVRNINSAHGQADTRLWVNLLALINSRLEPSIIQIKDKMNNYAELWSQKLTREKA
jgi:hypothetical protein